MTGCATRPVAKGDWPRAKRPSRYREQRSGRCLSPFGTACYPFCPRVYLRDCAVCRRSLSDKPPGEWRNGRRWGLKIPWGATPMRVRFPPRPSLCLDSRPAAARAWVLRPHPPYRCCACQHLWSGASQGGCPGSVGKVIPSHAIRRSRCGLALRRNGATIQSDARISRIVRGRTGFDRAG